MEISQILKFNMHIIKGTIPYILNDDNFIHSSANYKQY